MYTTCPSCTRQYRIRAGQLSIAAGEVRCGYCGEQFNALGRLSDEPLLLPEIETETQEAENVEAENLEEPYISEAVSEAPDTLEQMIEPSIDDEILDAEPQFDIGEIGEDDEIAHAVDSDEDIQDVGLDKVLSASEKLVDIPDTLLESKPSPRNFYVNLLWNFSALLLLIGLAAQLSWFNRDEILKKYPELLPEVKQLCEYFNCELLRQRNVHAIKLLNRDVRQHPIYSDTLLVNATMMNRSDVIQPFPRIQLTLFNTNGGMVAFKEFNPGEYLDDSIMINEGMFPDQPVHFALEVTGPTGGAVSFEFRFL